MTSRRRKPPAKPRTRVSPHASIDPYHFGWGQHLAKVSRDKLPKCCEAHAYEAFFSVLCGIVMVGERTPAQRQDAANYLSRLVPALLAVNEVCPPDEQTTESTPDVANDITIN